DRFAIRNAYSCALWRDDYSLAFVSSRGANLIEFSREMGSVSLVHFYENRFIRVNLLPLAVSFYVDTAGAVNCFSPHFLPLQCFRRFQHRITHILRLERITESRVGGLAAGHAFQEIGDL